MGQYINLLENIQQNTGKMTQPLKNKLTAAFAKKGLDGRGTFESISNGISTATSVLADYGIELDTVTNADLFREKQGHRNLDIAYTNRQDISSPMSITNSVLVFTWYEREKYNYEILCYIS